MSLFHEINHFTVKQCLTILKIVNGLEIHLKLLDLFVTFSI